METPIWGNWWRCVCGVCHCFTQCREAGVSLCIWPHFLFKPLGKECLFSPYLEHLGELGENGEQCLLLSFPSIQPSPCWKALFPTSEEQHTMFVCLFLIVAAFLEAFPFHLCSCFALFYFFCFCFCFLFICAHIATLVHREFRGQDLQLFLWVWERRIQETRNKHARSVLSSQLMLPEDLNNSLELLAKFILTSNIPQ